MSVNKFELKLRRVLDLQAEIDVRKTLYEELDRLTLELQAGGFVSAEIDGLTISLVDNFTEKNTVFRPAGVKRYEIKTQRPTLKSRTR